MKRALESIAAIVVLSIVMWGGAPLRIAEAHSGAANNPDVQAIPSEPGTFIAEDGFTFSYPPEWVLSEESPHSIWVASTEAALTANIFDFVPGQDMKANVRWGAFETMVRQPDLDPATTTASEIANAVFPIYYPIVREKQGPVDLTLGDTPVARIDGLDNQIHRVFLAFVRTDGTVVVVSGTCMEVDLAQFETVLLDIASSITGPGAASGPTPFNLTGPENCHNVAVAIADASSEFGSGGYSPAQLLDNNPTTGWSSDGNSETEYVVISLGGPQRVIGILFNSYSPSTGYTTDSIKDFRVEVPDGSASTLVFSGQAALVTGYQVYMFTPVIADSLRFVFTSTYGGHYFEAADIMICSATDGATGQVNRQWASSAQATSQYSDTEWNAAQATGAPDTGICDDIGTAWASLSATGVDDLTVSFDTPVIPQQVNIYQTFNPGSITGVTLIGETGQEFGIPNSSDPGTDCPGILRVAVPPNLTEGVAINRVRIHVDQRQIGDWNEIDAVELIGSP